MEAPAGGGRPRLSDASLKALREKLAEQLATLDARVMQSGAGSRRQARALQAQPRRDLDYVAFGDRG